MFASTAFVASCDGHRHSVAIGCAANLRQSFRLSNWRGTVKSESYLIAWGGVCSLLFKVLVVIPLFATHNSVSVGLVPPR